MKRTLIFAAALAAAHANAGWTVEKLEDPMTDAVSYAMTTLGAIRTLHFRLDSLAAAVEEVKTLVDRDRPNGVTFLAGDETTRDVSIPIREGRAGFLPLCQAVMSSNDRQGRAVVPRRAPAPRPHPGPLPDRFRARSGPVPGLKSAPAACQFVSQSPPSVLPVAQSPLIRAGKNLDPGVFWPFRTPRRPLAEPSKGPREEISASLPLYFCLKTRRAPLTSRPEV